MKVTKFAHSCFLIEDLGQKILIDPGIYSDQQNQLIDLNFVLITHEHPDHFDIDSIKQIISNNPTVKIITNTAVKKILDAENIISLILEDGNSLNENELVIEAIGDKHAIIHKSIPQFQNTGYFINNKLFYPGDSLTLPNREVEILALPVSGPWIKISEAIDYALEIKPKKCFPVHEALLITPGVAHRIPPSVLEPAGIEFIVIEPTESYQF
jgi:L-ascorbate metabolism protein UlaG (beta-lactamase superfamily)